MLSCPGGQGDAAMCAFDAVCPAGKGAAEWRAAFWRAAEKAGFRCVLPIRKDSRRAGGGGKRASPRKERSFSRTPSALRSPNEPFPTRNGDTPHLTDETRPLLLQNLPRLSIRSKRGPLQVAPHRPLISRRTSSAPQAQLSAPAKSQLSTLPAAVSSPHHPAGGTAGSARTRSRVQTLENPFWGSGAHLPRCPSPKRRRRQASARGPAAVYSLYRRNRNETKQVRPLLMGRTCVTHAPTALAAGPAG